MSSESSHPKWHGPFGSSELRVYNTLTGNKVNFLTRSQANLQANPNSANKANPSASSIASRQVGWYICGPTVYDSAHLGHARCYVTFDIIHRIMTDYFGYDVNYVMNVTDIDDKIILKARRNYLLKQYQQEALNNNNLDQLVNDINTSYRHSLEGLKQAKAKTEEELKVAPKQYHDDLLEKSQEDQIKISNVEKDYENYKRLLETVNQEEKSSSNNAPNKLQRLIDGSKSVLSEWVDSQKGSTVVDHSIFKAHSLYYEREFFEDMRELGVRDPTALTRVTEYVPQIITFIQQIMKNGFAYEFEHSIYFDTAKFQAAGHDYAKLSPAQAGNIKLTAEAEGSLSEGSQDKKKSAMDFALWKQSKPGEPAWDSPWGKGRPGWHIEVPN
jgi:cysteinyl-tRNA synthetase